MTRKLLVVFASGVIIAALLLSVAWLAGGRRFMTDVQHNNGWGITIDDDDGADTGPRVIKTLVYDGSQPLTLDAPVSLKFVRGTQNRVTVEGRREMVDAVRWENGRLYLADGLTAHHRLKVTVVAPQIPAVFLRGSGDIELNGLAQPTLAVNLSGAGNVEGNGKVDMLTITGRGAGNVDFSAVEAKDATVRVSGAGNVEIAATGKVDAALSGVGNITLHKKPAQLTTSISGIGSIDQDY
jgi:hypothetical protein